MRIRGTDVIQWIAMWFRRPIFKSSRDRRAMKRQRLTVARHGFTSISSSGRGRVGHQDIGSVRSLVFALIIFMFADGSGRF
jgi:hypothetical protein